MLERARGRCALISSYTKFYYAGSDLVAFTRSSGYGQDYGRRYVFKDHPSTSLRTSLGSTSVIVNGGGTKLWEERYYPYGESRYTYRKDQGGREIDLQTPMRYTGQRYDDAIGLYYYNARYYDPVLARFAQADTIVPEPGNPQSLNRYSYVGNQPTVFIDPTGMFSLENGELQSLLGFQDDQMFQDWWNNLEGTSQNLLLDAQWGDMISADINNTVYNLIFAQTEPGYGEHMVMDGSYYDSVGKNVIRKNSTIAFWDVGQSRSVELLVGLRFWELAQSSGSGGGLIPLGSDRHAWSASGQGDVGQGEWVWFESAALEGNADMQMIGASIAMWVVPASKAKWIWNVSKLSLSTLSLSNSMVTKPNHPPVIRPTNDFWYWQTLNHAFYYNARALQ